MTDTVQVIEVGPRDGLQNESALPVATRIELIERLVQAGVQHVEVGSFVSPRWVPQMAATDAVFAGLTRQPGVIYSALVPNLTGDRLAASSGADEVAVFTAASEAFVKKNINCSIDESLQRFEPVIAAARARGTRVRAYVSCILGCPWQGEVKTAAVIDVTTRLLAMGCDEVSLGDTIGVGTQRQVRALLKSLLDTISAQRLAMHFHDTYGQAVANVAASLDLGIRRFDAAVSGLGGCPYAAGASGNVATEELLYFFRGNGLESGIDLDAMTSIAWWISAALGQRPRSRVSLARTAETSPR